MEGVLGVAAMRRRIGQRLDDLEELDDRAWPAMCEQDRQGVHVLRAHMQEVDAESVNLCPVLGKNVQPLLDPTQVVTRLPVVCERLHLCQRYALGPVSDGFLLRPADCAKPSFEMIERGGRNVDLERRDVARRR